MENDNLIELKVRSYISYDPKYIQEDLLLEFLNGLLKIKNKDKIYCLEHFSISSNFLESEEANELFIKYYNKLKKYFNFSEQEEYNYDGLEGYIIRMAYACGHEINYYKKLKRYKKVLIEVSILSIV